MAEATKKWTTIINSNTGLFDLRLSELWRRRDLIWMFVWRDFISVYKQTILGPIWHVIQPLITAVMFALVFGKVAGVSTDGSPTLLFYLTGTILWTYFSNCLTNTATTLVTNANLFGKVYFPRLAIPIAIILSNLISFGIQAAITIVTMLIYVCFDANFHITKWILLTPLILAIMALQGLGLGLIVTALTTRYRDLALLVRFGTQLLMFATPVIYPLASVPAKYQWVVQINPLAPVFEVFRYGTLGRGVIEPWALLYSLTSTVLCIGLGILLFNRVEKTFVDNI